MTPRTYPPEFYERLKERDLPPEAADDYARTLEGQMFLVFNPLVGWLDRQLRRSPRLYTWLSK